MKIKDREDVNYGYIHRLQNPLRKIGKTVHRHKIVKLLAMQDKNLTFKSAKHLQKYNAKRQTEDDVSLYTYITSHLPIKFQKQRNFLLPIYKKAKQNIQKRVWKILDGEYTLFVNNKKIDLSIQQALSYSLSLLT